MTVSLPRKKLIEVSIPLEAINRASAHEKMPGIGAHPRGIHIWWARRPLAACRAVLFAQFVDDPSSCPEEFPVKAAQDAERDRLHKLIEAMVPWEATRNHALLDAARYEIARSVARSRDEKLPPLAEMGPGEIIAYLQANAPPVYDPFSGGGSIPLEAQRLGLRAIGSDLNPVAVLIGKALVEFPPKFAGRKPVNPEADELRHWSGAEGLADDVRYYGRWMRSEAEKKIGHLYPKVKLKNGKEATVIAWLWARTVPSPDPRANGAPVPLVSSFVLSTNTGKEVIVTPVVDRAKMTWHFEVDDKPSKADLETANKGTKAARGANFVCLLTGAAIDDVHVKREAKAGRLGVVPMAIVAEGLRGRMYLAPTPDHAAAAKLDSPDASEVDQPLPKNPRWFSPPDYGMPNYIDLFTPRQLTALTTFSDLVIEARERALANARKHWAGAHADDARQLAHGGLGPMAYADAVATYLGFIVGRISDFNSTICRWNPSNQKTMNTFARQAIPMTWDFGEPNTLGFGVGSWAACSDYVSSCLAIVPAYEIGSCDQFAAQDDRFPQLAVVSTDPPYYDNIGYADLSDYFYVWLRRTLKSVHSDLFRRVLTPKKEELVATPYRHGGKISAEAFFLQGMKDALAGIAKTSAAAPATVYYAFKQSELSQDGVTSAGWATFLQAVTDCGLSVDGTWPIRSEQSERATAKGTNALASSIVLICRGRDTSAQIVTRADFLRALRREMPAALAEIRRAGVGPTDIQQAAIGPGIGIFTRYAQVLNTNGTAMLVKDALKLINQVREEIASHGDADYDSETRFALDWFAAKGFDTGASGEAINMTNAVNLSLEDIRGAGFFEAMGGKARLKKRGELPDDWDPATAKRATVWEACQHLIKRLSAENGGLDATAALYNGLGALAAPAHALARRLYDICEQKQWATEGRAYNKLYREWDAIEQRAAALAGDGGETDLFVR